MVSRLSFLENNMADTPSCPCDQIMRCTRCGRKLCHHVEPAGGKVIEGHYDLPDIGVLCIACRHPEEEQQDEQVV